MLTADFLDVAPDPIIALFRQLEDSVIADMARRLAKMDMSASTAWQMQRLSESGVLYEDVLEKLASVTNRSEAELATLFEQAGVKTMAFDDSIYKAAGLEPLPLNLSPAMAQTLRAGLAKTGGIMRNLTMTTALDAQTAFISMADLAYMQVSTGVMDYNTAIKHAIKSAANQGLFVTYPTGHRDHLDVAMRRTVLTGVSQTASQLQERRADEMGTDLVQTSAHIGARPSHQRWQGQIFSRNGRHKKYPDFVSSTGYGTGAGLSGWNCRHSWYPFFEGISENAYSKADLKSFANQKVTYNGEPISVYDATQEQRAIERNIRRTKREAGALEAAGLDNTAERLALGRYQAQMRDFTRQTGLSRQSVREQVYAGPGTKVRALRTAPKTKTGTKPEVKRQTPRDLVVEHGGVSKLRSEIDPGLDAIGKVHAVDGMPKVLLTDGEGIPLLDNKAMGLYAPNSVAPAKSGDPRDLILCKPGTRDKAATVVHEYGHMVDHRGFGTDDLWGSERAATMNEGPMVEWWKAMQETPEYKKLRAMTANPSDHSWIEEDSTGKYRVTPDPKFTAYLSEPKELWARSYAQYIGRKTGNQYNLEGNDQHHPFTWSDDSFGSIESAITNILRSKGWLR